MYSLIVMEEIEKRRLERFDLEVPAEIEWVTSDHKRDTLNLSTSNICSNGAFFHTDTPLPEGTDVRMDLILLFKKLKKPKNRWLRARIKITGKVLRSESKGMAIGFNKNYQITPWIKEQSCKH